jgi:hypothetical protein
MKNLLLLSLLAILVFSCSNDSTNKRYGIKSGIITYKTSMMGMETSKTVYFKDYGAIETNLVDGGMMGMTGKSHQVQKDGFIYMYQEGQKEGMKIKIADSIATEQSNLFTEESIVKKEGGKKTGTEKILEKECSVYEITKDGINSKIWIWNKIPLKMTVSQQGMEVVMIATELKETSDFPKGIFDLPSEITFKEMKDEQQNTPNFEEPEITGDSTVTEGFDDPNAKG